MSHETKKATERRWGSNGCFWRKVFIGAVLDIGPGDDPLFVGDWPECIRVTPFDKEQGDANKIDEYFLPETFDCVHGSQVLEHLFNPDDAIKRMMKLIKSGGYLVLTVPDFDLYEQGNWPSKWNPDHKSTWSLWRTQPPTKAQHVWVPRLITHYPSMECSLQCSNYDWMLRGTDQTWEFEKRVECFIEMVIRKP